MEGITSRRSSRYRQTNREESPPPPSPTLALCSLDAVVELCVAYLLESYLNKVKVSQGKELNTSIVIQRNLRVSVSLK